MTRSYGDDTVTHGCGGAPVLVPVCKPHGLGLSHHSFLAGRWG
jgi:hypothetical protein